MSANEEVTARILADLGTADRGVVVDSPPGAGKSTLVVGAAAVLTDGGEQVMIIAQTTEQVDDYTSRPTAISGLAKQLHSSAPGGRRDHRHQARGPGRLPRFSQHRTE